MAKKFEGLDAIIQPTTEETGEKKTLANCNILLEKRSHFMLKVLAMQEGKTLKALVQEIIEDYIDNHPIKI